MVAEVHVASFAHNNHHDEPPPLTKTTWLLLALTSLAVMGGFTFGYDTGIVSGSMLIIKNQLYLNNVWQELVVAMTTVGAAVASLVGGMLTTAFGKKYVILGACLSFIAGALVCAFSPTKEVLLVGRLIVGVAIGIYAVAVPPYVAECSPIHVRGRLLVMFQTLINSGFFMSGILAAALNYIPDHNLSWRLMLGIAAVPAAIQFVGFCFMPESPRWLVSRGREEEGVAIMERIFGGDDIAAKNAEFEVRLIKEGEAQAERERQELGISSRFPLVAALRIPHIRKAIIVGCSLQICQQLSGINTIMYYSASIMTMAGVSDPTTALWLASLSGGCLFAGGLVGLFLVDKIGRRKLVVSSGSGVFVCLILMGIAFELLAVKSPLTKTTEQNITFRSDEKYSYGDDPCVGLGCDACSYQTKCGFCFSSKDPWGTGACVAHSDYQDVSGDGRNWAAYGRCTRDFNTSTDPNSFPLAVDGSAWNYGFCPTQYSWLPILGMVLYLLWFSIGYAPMPWAVNGELYPNWARSTGSSLSSASQWIANIVVSMTFLTLANAITRQGTYFLYAGLTLFGVIWLYLIMPETKGKDIEEIQYSMMGKFFSRGKDPPRRAKIYQEPPSINAFRADDRVLEAFEKPMKPGYQ